MKFAFLIMGDFNSTTDRAFIHNGCNLTTGFICTDTLIILDSPLCEGVFRSEN